MHLHMRVPGSWRRALPALPLYPHTRTACGATTPGPGGASAGCAAGQPGLWLQHPERQGVRVRVYVVHMRACT